MVSKETEFYLACVFNQKKHKKIQILFLNLDFFILSRKDIRLSRYPLQALLSVRLFFHNLYQFAQYFESYSIL